MEMALAVGLAIRRERQLRGYSQEALSEAAGLDRTYISGLERGQRNPALYTLLRLADPLEIRLSRLFQAAERIHDGRLRVPAPLTRPTRRSRKQG